YNGNQALASAGYNAGERRADRWRPQRGSIDSDIWVDTIPFNETRNFVKNVLAYATVYNNRLGGEIVRISSRMPPVTAKNSVAQN
ncbi:MAG: lytic murein transglycosylase, partial [Gammaproteobacteria bacterium]|nr:lytic murein transglycosylase [Gammaproteobacteria bacterium]